MTNIFPVGQYLKLFIAFFFTTTSSGKFALHTAQLMSATSVGPSSLARLLLLMPQSCVQRPRSWISKIVVDFAEHAIFHNH